VPQGDVLLQVSDEGADRGRHGGEDPGHPVEQLQGDPKPSLPFDQRARVDEPLDLTHLIRADPGQRGHVVEQVDAVDALDGEQRPAGIGQLLRFPVARGGERQVAEDGSVGIHREDVDVVATDVADRFVEQRGGVHHVLAHPAQVKVLREPEPLQADQVPVREGPRRHRDGHQAVSALREMEEVAPRDLADQAAVRESPVHRDDVRDVADCGLPG
jgi:hypothetical protein